MSHVAAEYNELRQILSILFELLLHYKTPADVFLALPLSVNLPLLNALDDTVFISSIFCLIRWLSLDSVDTVLYKDDKLKVDIC